MRANNYERGFYNSVVDRYVDPTHFVFELLQNAEDQNASHVEFAIEPDSLIFRHDGEPFLREDVEDITGWGNSHKNYQANKIGRYGVGFKSGKGKREGKKGHY